MPSGANAGETCTGKDAWKLQRTVPGFCAKILVIARNKAIKEDRLAKLRKASDRALGVTKNQPSSSRAKIQAQEIVGSIADGVVLPASIPSGIEMLPAAANE